MTFVSLISYSSLINNDNKSKKFSKYFSLILPNSSIFNPTCEFMLFFGL